MTGSYCTPHGGFKSFGLEKSKKSDKESLPVAHTCFN